MGSYRPEWITALDAPALDDLQQDHNDGDNEKNMNKSPHRVGGDQSQ